MSSETNRQALDANYGFKTVDALDDFLVHADLAAWALSQRSTVDPRISDLMAEALMVRIGESAARAGARFPADYPDLDFRGIVDARNFAAHGYDTVDADLLWEYFERDLPIAAARVREMLTG